MPRAALLLLLPLFTACDGEEPTPLPRPPTQETTRVDDILALTGDIDEGQAVFGRTCAACHGLQGQGSTAPALTNTPDWEDADFVQLILDGTGPMPGFAQQLDDQEIADLLAFVRDTFPG